MVSVKGNDVNLDRRGHACTCTGVVCGLSRKVVSAAQIHDQALSKPQRLSAISLFRIQHVGNKQHTTWMQAEMYGVRVVLVWAGRH